MELEHTLFFFIYNLGGESILLDRFMIWLARFYPHLLVAVGGILFLRSSDKGRKIIFVAFLAALLSYSLNLPLRHLLFRARPFVEYQITPLIEYAASRSSFPSNHTAASSAFALFIYLYEKKVGIFLMVMAFLVGLSRIYTGVHYPGDIVAGLLIGLAGALLSRWVKEKGYI